MARFRAWAMLLLCCVSWFSSPSARADDVADEADLPFELGTQRYERQDFKHALSHFLASNRLARNRNVLLSVLARLSPRVPLLHVVSDPPGAHLYIDRRDLGERGTAPQTMALARGTYRIFAELDGCEAAQSDAVKLPRPRASTR